MEVSWKSLSEQVMACKACRLCETRTHTVFGEGNVQAALMLIGEGPGEQEDVSGRPFVGPAGQLLDRILMAAGFKRKDVYICNIVKCRPPHNRVPAEDECAACRDYLRGQVALVRPKVIVLLGSTATKAILGQEMRITRDRGVWQLKKGMWIMPTYHPSALLRDATKKRPVWEDFQAVRDKIKKLEGRIHTEDN
ncbi:MAG: uracil-DNA glycosylase [Clostridia bacterium]|nr:uracil-DNA glycosylase [Clostridia bacterium]